MGSYVIGIDAGGTMTKAALFDLKGHEIACARRRNVMLFPNVGWTERDPDAMWNAAATAIKEVIDVAAVNPGNILGVAVSGYGSGLYLVDRDGNPVRNGIISTDDRAQDILADWTDRGLVPSVQEKKSINTLGGRNLWC